MKILIQSYVFSPSIGGTETATRLLAIGLKELGHEVKVVTDTEAEGSTMPSIEVHRRVSTGEFLRLLSWSNVFIHSNISVRNAWPLLIYWRPWVIIHHSRIELAEGQRSLLSRLKQWLAGFATNVAVSKFMAGSLRSPSVVIKNPYADDVFRISPGTVRDRDFIVVGRFLDDKGFQVAIEALSNLHQRGFNRTRMTIVGEGPYSDQLVAFTREKGLQDAIEFTGLKAPEDLARLFNQHRTLIVPSLSSETFGLVAVEGMACGCLVVGSDVGGLKETIGPCGLTFTAGDVEALTNLLQSHLEHPELSEPYLKAAPGHLEQFKRAHIIPTYADCIQQAVERWEGKA